MTAMKSPPARLTCAGALLLVAMPALAQQGPYLGLYGGANFAADADVEDVGVSGLEADLDTGAVFGGVVGYSHEVDTPGLENLEFRSEIDIGYRTNGLDSLSGAFDFNLNGDLDTFHAMTNLWFDYRIGRFQPYVGGGLGVAVASLDDAEVAGIAASDDEATVFAYQLGAGLGYELTERWTVSLDYRFFDTMDPEFDLEGGGDFELETRHHSAMATARFQF